MTETASLHERLSALYRAGMARAVSGLWSDPRIEDDVPLKPAAVLIAVSEAGEPEILLTHRPTTMRAHPGQIALPGGRCEEGEDAIAAALREAEEEVGLLPEDVRVIGELDVIRTASGYEITPVLATIPTGLTFTPNPAEVADWFAAPAAYVLDPARHGSREVEWKGRKHRVIEIDWQGRRIWGVTGAILANLTLRIDWAQL
ncbi:CoA pyrophosphatase [Novosphingobium terrae]|uniref:CoA pyrophosphatase n=1 Tax=Novosphingobium terrae TaxID=2726189 RepID=UPI00197F7452|nr:CoA pyrophosphatase [Novosphingobium terrae]